MKLVFKDGDILKERSNALILGVYEDGLDEMAKRVDKRVRKKVSKLLSSGEFEARLNSTSIIHAFGGFPSERLLLVGLGKHSEFTIEKLRQASGTAAVAVRNKGLKNAVSSLHLCEVPEASPSDVGQAIAEATTLALYRFGKYKTEKDVVKEYAKEIKSLVLPEKNAARCRELRSGAGIGEKIAKAVSHVRDLVSEPAGVLTPTELANRARDLSKEHGFKCSIIMPEGIKKLNMGAFLAVAQGSHQPPRLIVLEHNGGGAARPLVLVGKAITFDSGGISIKPWEGMEEMKDDMSGGAAVLGAVCAAAQLKLPINLVGIIPSTENLPGGGAYKPGDVLRSMSGITIEVISTDAEGRLILCDALAYAARYKPAAIIDLATLTGACVVALGHVNSGLMGNDEGLLKKIEVASRVTSEKVWRLPLDDEYAKQIKSDIADVKNVGGRPAGTITAALFLKKFVGDTPWAHLDIAGTAWTKEAMPYCPKGATGIGVRLLTELARAYYTT
ncbi:MAG: leucyl aminopeptidase [Candidatus Abyssobacteria bacterium SURF_17]|uniref:Probable cytosol aminopeptidase n=1 Tax=Candidatus Abyssobacteria bacterium SURF_17 TaxID=2093361 RepID=A0A419EQB9_9BACT|nr:MAG: leucyl aminopeptidase [Candidatus Abyssubacteria bacterium SURF_17]